MTAVVEAELGPLRYRFEARGGHAWIYYGGRVSTVDIARTWLGQIDDFLLEHGLARVIWDSRQAEGHPPDVRTVIWEWLTAARVLKASAILAESEMLRVSANLSSMSSGLKLRSFGDADAAHEWLMAQRI